MSIILILFLAAPILKLFIREGLPIAKSICTCSNGIDVLMYIVMAPKVCNHNLHFHPQVYVVKHLPHPSSHLLVFLWWRINKYLKMICIIPVFSCNSNFSSSYNRQTSMSIV